MDSTEPVIGASSKRAQSAIEYLTTYGWAILIIAIIVSILYLYIAVPSQITTNSCNFVSGASCQDFVVGTNAITHVTKAEFWLTNTQPDPIENPTLYVRYAGQNTTPVTCLPTNTLIITGGLVNCTVTLPGNATLASLVAGNLYLEATYCGLSNQSYQSTLTCKQAAQQTYTGSFTAHVQPQEPIKVNLILTAANLTQLANGEPDMLTANVRLSTFPLKGATVNFTANNTAYYLNPNLTNTNVNGNALSEASSTAAGNVTITATYAGVSNSIKIDFIAPIYVVYLSTNFQYCSTETGTIGYIDGAAYTCSQLSGKQFTYGRGTMHSYSFVTPVSISSGIQGIFTNLTINGIPYTDPSGNIITDTNLTIPFSYYPQYYFTEAASPSSGGSVTPGSGWYNSLSPITISESPNSGYAFNDWVGSSSSGTPYSGSATTATATIGNAPLSETAYFTSTSTTSTSSTSSTSTSTTTSSTTSSTVVGTTSSTTTSSTSSTVVGTYSVQISESPSDAANTWGACFQVSGYSQVCAGNGASTASGTYPAGSVITYVCTAQWVNPTSYEFSSWTGVYTGGECESGLNIPINSNLNIVANYAAVPLANIWLGATNGNVIGVDSTGDSIVATIPIRGTSSGIFGAGDIMVTPNNQEVYVEGSSSVDVISTATDTVTGTISPNCNDFMAAPGGADVYCIDESGAEVLEISTSTNQVVATISLAAYGFSELNGYTMTPNGAYIYIANENGGTGTILVISTATNSVVTTISTDSYMSGLVATPNSAYVYAADYDSSDVWVISTSTNTVVATISVGTEPTEISISPNGAYVFVMCYQGLYEISTSNNQVATTFQSNNYGVPIDGAIGPTADSSYVLTNSQYASASTGGLIFITTSNNNLQANTTYFEFPPDGRPAGAPVEIISSGSTIYIADAYDDGRFGYIEGGLYTLNEASGINPPPANAISFTYGITAIALAH